MPILYTLSNGGAGCCGSNIPPSAIRFSVRAEGYATLTIEDFLVTPDAKGDKIAQVEIFAPSVDETDIGWYGHGTIGDGSTDPVTFTPTIVGSARAGTDAVDTRGGLTQTDSAGTGIVTVGRAFQVGDFIVWNDINNYEIDQITAIVGSSYTLKRHTAGTPTSPVPQAQYGSWTAAHTDKAFFRLINKVWIRDIDFTTGPQVLKLPWDNMCVAAVRISLPKYPTFAPITINLAPDPGNTRLQPPCPGLRTMNGAEYIGLTCSGTLTAGQTADKRVSVTSAWESIRCISGTVRTAPTDADLKVSVVYITPDLGTAALIDSFTIADGLKQSYDPSTNGLDGRQMPFHEAWTSPNYASADWPPEVLPALTGAFDADGNLQLGFSVTTSPIPFQPGGYIDMIVTQVGSTVAGAELSVAVQT